MIFTLEPVTGPDIEPVTVEELKRDLGEFSGVTDKDADMAALITSAREWAENLTGLACIDQTWRLTVGQPATLPVRGAVSWAADNAWSRCGILLRRSPVLSIVSFGTVDADGVETAVDPADYALREADSKWPRIVALGGAAWTTGTFRILLRAGYADRKASPQQDASVVPARLKQAIRLPAQAHFDADENMERLIKAATALLAPTKTGLGMA